MLGNVSWPGTVVSKCLNKRGSVSDPTMSGWTQNLPLRQWGRTGQACHMHTWGPGEVDARSKPPPDARESKRAERQRWSLFLQVPASLPGTLGANDSLQVSCHHAATLLGCKPPSHLSNHLFPSPPPPSSALPLTWPPLLLT